MYCHGRPVVLMLLLSFCTAAEGGDTQRLRYDQRNLERAREREESFVGPATYYPSSSGTRVVLEVKYAENLLGDAKLRHRSYNGGLTGPVIRVRPGTSLDVRLINDLPGGEPTGGGHEPNIPHGFDITNLHTHGLHVSPEGNSDNVFLEVLPGSSIDLRFDIPGNHPAGTFWYHAHKHGSVAVQLASGMAGALIVEGGLDEAPALRGVVERVLVLQQYTYRTIPGQPAVVNPDDIYSGFAASDTAESVTTVNGQLTPTLVMRPGELQRWRFVHAGIADSIDLSLPGLKLYEIAVDGLATGRMTEVDHIELQPGYRSDVLIKAPTPAPIADARARTFIMKTEVRDVRRSLRKRIVAPRAVIKLVVAGTPHDMPLPDPSTLASYAPFTDADVPDDTGIFTRMLRFKIGEHNDFLINDTKFDPDHLAEPFLQPVRQNTAEKWLITAEGGSHPFHVHVNPFAVKLTDSGNGGPKWLWRDTLYVVDGDTAEIRSKFTDFSGKTALHCHILDHEDQGMMRWFQISPPTVQGGEGSGQGVIGRAAASIPGRGLSSLPAASPSWALTGPDGELIRSDDLRGRPTLLVLHRGLACPHCAVQVGALAKNRPALDAAGLNVIAVSPRLPDPETLKRDREALAVTFPLLADPKLSIFRLYGCMSARAQPLHGVFLHDAAGRVIWQTVGEQPENDVSRLLANVRTALAGGAEPAR